MDIKERKIEAIRGVLMKFLLPDCLRPEWDGMSTYEIGGQILTAIENTENE